MTWEDILSFAYGELRLSPSEFWELTWYEFDLFSEGYLRREDNEWRHTREIMAMIYNTSGIKRSQRKKGSQLIPLDSDKHRFGEISISPKKHLSRFMKALKRYTKPTNGKN